MWAEFLNWWIEADAYSWERIPTIQKEDAKKCSHWYNTNPRICYDDTWLWMFQNAVKETGVLEAAILILTPELVWLKLLWESLVSVRKLKNVWDKVNVKFENWDKWIAKVNKDKDIEITKIETPIDKLKNVLWERAHLLNQLTEKEKLALGIVIIQLLATPWVEKIWFIGSFSKWKMWKKWSAKPNWKIRNKDSDIDIKIIKNSDYPWGIKVMSVSGLDFDIISLPNWEWLLNRTITDKNRKYIMKTGSSWFWIN